MLRVCHAAALVLTLALTLVLTLALTVVGRGPQCLSLCVSPVSVCKRNPNPDSPRGPIGLMHTELKYVLTQAMPNNRFRAGQGTAAAKEGSFLPLPTPTASRYCAPP